MEAHLPSGETFGKADMSTEAAILEPDGTGRARMWLKNDQLFPVSLTEGPADQRR